MPQGVFLKSPFIIDNAIKAGATKNEILEAAAIGVEVEGGPSFVIVRDNLLDSLDDIEKRKKEGILSNPHPHPISPSDF